MARKIKSRYKIKGTLICQTPIHVGGIGGNTDTDMALAVNGAGKFYIPGTSLAGALQSWMEAINPQITNRLWGYQDENNDDEGHASFILVEDAPISSSVIMEIRDGVAIDRFFGTAVESMKFDRAILPKNTIIPLEITLDREHKDKPENSQLLDAEWEDKQEKKWQESQQLFALLIKALKEGDIYLGGAKSRGLGKVKLYDEKINKQNLCTSKGILEILKNKNTLIPINNVDWSNLYTSDQIWQNKLNIKIYWHPISSVMVKSEGDGIAVDMLPLVSQVDNELSFVIPGSSLKGIWRSQAERIIRTVCDKDITEDKEDKYYLCILIIATLLNNEYSRFLTFYFLLLIHQWQKLNPRQKFQKDIKLNLVKTLFGGMAEFDNGKQLGGLASLYFADCYAQLAMTDKQWERIVNAQYDNEKSDAKVDSEIIKENNLRSALNEAGLENTEQVYHVAIDRWTGGASEGALYTVLEPKGFKWHPIEINFNLDRLKRQLKHDLSTEKDEETEEKVKQNIALFLLVLRDFIKSKIPIGFGTNRGMGAIEVNKIEVNYQGQENYLQNLFAKNAKDEIDVDKQNKFQELFNHDSLQIIDDAWKNFHSNQEKS